jgi:predicted SAM-dependent methyltransferase
LGCGFNKFPAPWINVDRNSHYEPDVLHDLNFFHWPWKDESIDFIYAGHIFEHFDDWWEGFKECDRLLRPGGQLEIRTPDFADTNALTPRGHKNVFSLTSFSGTRGILNEWRKNYPDRKFPEYKTNLALVEYKRIPDSRYVKWWFPAWLIIWCMDHLNNFATEQIFRFIKTGDGA